MKTMITQSQAEAAGWRILAGGFFAGSSTDRRISNGIIQHISQTGGRAALVRRDSGRLAVYRPMSEMETAEQTERRIERAQLRGN